MIDGFYFYREKMPFELKRKNQELPNVSIFFGVAAQRPIRKNKPVTDSFDAVKSRNYVFAVFVFGYQNFAVIFLPLHAMKLKDYILRFLGQ